MTSHTVASFKEYLETSGGGGGLVLDIDETLAATNVAWFERCIQLFGNPDNLPVPQLIDKYHLAQNNPAWQTKAAKEWMQRQRDDPAAQDGLPQIPGAVEGVRVLYRERPEIFVGYLTVRPERVNANTLRWLQENGFPPLPLVAKPDDVPFETGNQWKAQALKTLYPHVTGIVDDNPKVPTYAGRDYQGKIFLYGRGNVEQPYEWAIPCETWPIVVNQVKNMCF